MHLLRVPVSAWQWLRRMTSLLREARGEEQRILSVRDSIARELRQNARVADGFHGKSWSIQSVQAQLHNERWHQYADAWALLRKRHPDLWQHVADMYERLDETRLRGIAPPATGELTELADRLEKAGLD